MNNRDEVKREVDRVLGREVLPRPMKPDPKPAIMCASLVTTIPLGMTLGNCILSPGFDTGLSIRPGMAIQIRSLVDDAPELVRELRSWADQIENVLQRKE